MTLNRLVKGGLLTYLKEVSFMVIYITSGNINKERSLGLIFLVYIYKKSGGFSPLLLLMY